MPVPSPAISPDILRRGLPTLGGGFDPRALLNSPWGATSAPRGPARVAPQASAGMGARPPMQFDPRMLLNSPWEALSAPMERPRTVQTGSASRGMQSQDRQMQNRGSLIGSRSRESFNPEAFGRIGNNGSFSQLRPASLDNLRSPGPGSAGGGIENILKLLSGGAKTAGSKPLIKERDTRQPERPPNGGGREPGLPVPRKPVPGAPNPPVPEEGLPPPRRPGEPVAPTEPTPVPKEPYYEPGGESTGGPDPYRTPGSVDDFADMVYQILYGGAGQADYTEAFNPLRVSMEEQVQRSMADTLEQFGNMGSQYGSGSLEGVGEVGRRGAQDINSIMGELSFAADESNRQRMMQGALQLGQQLYGSQEGAANRELETLIALLSNETQMGIAGMGLQGDMAGLMAQISGMFQGVDQAGLDAAYQEWLRQESGYSDEIINFLGNQPQTSSPYYESGWFDQFMPFFTGMMGGTPFGDWFGNQPPTGG